MSEEIAIAYQRMHALGMSAMRLLPNIVIALLVLLLFVLAARQLRALVQRLNAGKYHENLVIVLGRLSQWVLSCWAPCWRSRSLFLPSRRET